jgi:hypothetical protein
MCLVQTRRHKLGTPHNDPRLVVNEQRCVQADVTKYFEKERKCRACMRADREREENTRSEREEEE